jgi:hypothetical protein
MGREKEGTKGKKRESQGKLDWKRDYTHALLLSRSQTGE